MFMLVFKTSPDAKNRSSLLEKRREKSDISLYAEDQEQKIEQKKKVRKKAAIKWRNSIFFVALSDLGSSGESSRKFVLWAGKRLPTTQRK